MQPPLLPFPGDPVPQRRPSPAKRRGRANLSSPWTRRIRSALPVLCAAIIGAASFMALTHGGTRVRADLVVLQPGFERLARLAGFGIDEVHITGHAFTPDSEIYDSLDLDNVRTFMALDTAAVRSRIERLAWVATADLTRVYPGRLEVRIAERKPYAVWRRGDREALIDRSGRPLASINSGSVNDLPRVAGEGANMQVSALLSLLDRFPALRGRLESGEWVGERRWTLYLANNVTLHLPAGREAPALEAVAARGKLESLVAAPNRIIDLRAPGRIAVRDVAAVRPVGAGVGLLSGSGT